MGLANYFRDFVENFSSRVVGMAAMQSKKLPFCWSEELEKEFVDIKGAIAAAPMLVGIDYDFPIIVRTDASKVGVGAVLLQLRAGVECPVAFVSQKFSDEASRWSTIDQEAYAVYFALQQWSGYLRGQQFVVQTDHKNLVYVAKSDVGRVARWRLFLQEFDFVVQHLPGSTNVVADALSRCLVLTSEVSETISRFHNETVGHSGVKKTIQLLKRHGVVWESMRSDVVQFIQSCAICQKTRCTALDKRVEETHVIESYEPFQEVSLDSVVNLPEDQYGNKVILVIIDNFTRFVELFAVKDVSVETAAEALLSVCGRYGAVSIIRSDNGGQFVGEIFKKMVQLMGSKQLLTVGYKPSANGIVERANAEVVRHLSAIVRSRGIQQMWSLGLPLVQRILNKTVHSSVGYSPAELFFGNAVSLVGGILSVPPGSSLKEYPTYVIFSSRLFQRRSCI